MQGYGFRVEDSGGDIVIASRPRPGQKLYLVVVPLAGALSFVSAVIAERPIVAAAVAVITIAVTLFFYRSLRISSSERLMFSEGWKVEWVRVPILSPVTYTRTLDEIPADGKGHKFKVVTHVYRSRHEGSHTTFHGRKATLSIHASRGQGQGYERVLRLDIVAKEMEALTEWIIERLPDSRAG